MPVPQILVSRPSLAWRRPSVPPTSEAPAGGGSAVDHAKKLTVSALFPARVAVAALRACPIGYDLGVERGLARKVLQLGPFECARVVCHAPSHQCREHCRKAQARHWSMALREGEMSHVGFLLASCLLIAAAVRIAADLRRSARCRRRLREHGAVPRISLGQTPTLPTGRQAAGPGLLKTRSVPRTARADAFWKSRFRQCERVAPRRDVGPTGRALSPHAERKPR